MTIQAIDKEKYRILLVDDEEGIRFTLGCFLKKEGFQVEVAANHGQAITHLASASYDLVFVDIMLGTESGVTLLREIKSLYPAIQVVMFTGCPGVESAAEAVRLGAFDYLTKPVRPETLMAVCLHALHSKSMNDERELYRANLDAIFRTVSDSIIMVDREGRLVQFNTTACNSCGYTKDLLGQEADSISLGCAGVCRTALLQTLQSTEPKELRRFECRTPKGITRIVSFTSTPVVESDGSIGGAVAVIRDETRLVKLERSLQLRGQYHALIGASAPMQRIYSLIEALSDVPTTVLINGESGTGKELVAAALHNAGTRTRGSFVKVNCSALSEALLESELFGHVRGAFTGAIADKQGRFQKAHGGTLFLDEIGDVSAGIQMRLLRVLQEGEFERVGDSTPIKVDVRIVAATNQNLADKVALGSFRQDLFYRLNVVRMVLPPLRDRLEDLEALVAHFIAKFNTRIARDIAGVSEDVMEIFHTHSWPGNVRELEHALEHAVILCKTNIITVSDLPQDLLDALKVSGSVSSTTIPDFTAEPHSTLTIEEALALTNGNKTRAAQLLGISRRTVYRHMEE